MSEGAGLTIITDQARCQLGVGFCHFANVREPGAYENYVSCSAKLGQLYVDLGKEAFKSYQDLAANLAPVK
jgi:hypothetical protein